MSFEGKEWGTGESMFVPLINEVIARIEKGDVDGGSLARLYYVICGFQAEKKLEKDPLLLEECIGALRFMRDHGTDFGLQRLFCETKAPELLEKLEPQYQHIMNGNDNASGLAEDVKTKLNFISQRVSGHSDDPPTPQYARDGVLKPPLAETTIPSEEERDFIRGVHALLDSEDSTLTQEEAEEVLPRLSTIFLMTRSSAAESAIDRIFILYPDLGAASRAASKKD